MLVEIIISLRLFIQSFAKLIEFIELSCFISIAWDVGLEDRWRIDRGWVLNRCLIWSYLITSCISVIVLFFCFFIHRNEISIIVITVILRSTLIEIWMRIALVLIVFLNILQLLFLRRFDEIPSIIWFF